MATLVIKEGEKPYIEDIWLLEDFRGIADGYPEFDFSDDDLIEAMELVASNFDANLGITWETIECALDVIVFNKRGSKND